MDRWRVIKVKEFSNEEVNKFVIIKMGLELVLNGNIRLLIQCIIEFI